MMKKAVIFDFDGTLSDTFPVVFEAINSAFDSLGLARPSRETVYANFGPQELGVFKRIVPEHAEVVFRAYLDATKRIIERDGLFAFDGIEPLLQSLKARGFALHIVTGKSRESLGITLDAIKTGKYFDILKWGAETGSVKPERMREIFAETKMNPEDFYYVGDSVQDVLDCRKVGVDALSAAWANCADIAGLEKVSAKIFRSPEEAGRFILG